MIIKRGEHRAPTIYNLVSEVVGDSVVVLDGPEYGDILIKAEQAKNPFYFDYSFLGIPTGDKYDGSSYTYYLVTRVSKPNGVCSGHSLLTVKVVE